MLHGNLFSCIYHVASLWTEWSRMPTELDETQYAAWLVEDKTTPVERIYYNVHYVDHKEKLKFATEMRLFHILFLSHPLIESVRAICNGADSVGHKRFTDNVRWFYIFLSFHNTYGCPSWCNMLALQYSVFVYGTGHVPHEIVTMDSSCTIITYLFRILRLITCTHRFWDLQVLRINPADFKRVY